MSNLQAITDRIQAQLYKGPPTRGWTSSGQRYQTAKGTEYWAQLVKNLNTLLDIVEKAGEMETALQDTLRAMGWDKGTRTWGRAADLRAALAAYRTAVKEAK